MWYESSTAAAPTEIVTLTQAKAQVRVDDSDNDDYLTSLISAARSFVEQYCGIKIGTQTVTAKCDSFADLARLPEAPVTALTSIGYLDTDGVAQTVGGAVYEARLDGLESAAVLKYGQTWPAQQFSSRLTVVATVGYTTLTLPPAVLQAMLLLIGDWFGSRETMVEGRLAQLPFSAEALLTNYRRGA